MLKTCSKCKLPKPIDDFYKDERHKDGHHSGCIECHKQNNKNWRTRNKSKVKDYNANRGKELISHNIMLFAETAKTLGLRTTLTREHIDESIAHWNKKCAYCGDQPTIIDYILPINKKYNGPNIKNNIIPACDACYKLKNDTDLFFYAITTGKSITSILIWAAKDYALIAQINAYRERLYNHSFVDDMKIAIQAATFKPQT